MIGIDEPSGKSPSSFALFRLGFRPFFLFGAIFSAFALVHFILLMSGVTAFLPSRWDMLVWHKHEMLFGYAAAIIGGFLLTAVPNWTGHPTPKGVALVMIFLLWLAGRVMIFFSAWFPEPLVAVVDISFFLACMAGIFPALVKSQNRRNYFFLLLLLLLAAANGLAHWDEMDIGIRLGLDIVIMMMIIIGGRVIPFFTERPLGIAISRSPRIEHLVLVSTIAALMLDVAEANETMLGMAFLLAGIANGWRLSQWRSLKTLKVPLLWVLHAGYAWLVIGFLARAFYYFGTIASPSIGTHAFTAGGIGVLTLGMMARVSLGHTGRPLAVGKAMIAAFACINLVAATRVLGVWLFPGLMWYWFQVAAGFWLLAFVIFIVVYTPILLQPRVDGRDG